MSQVERGAEHSSSLSNKMSHAIESAIDSGMELLAQMSFGHSVLRAIDRILYIVEKSTQWSLPAQEILTEENGKSFEKAELVRPLPWVLFLPALIVLRTIRFGINLGAFVLNFPQVQPTDTIKFAQKYRRRLRNLQCNGMKILRHRKVDSGGTTMEKDGTIRRARLNVLQGVSALFCSSKVRKSSSPSPTRIIAGADGTVDEMSKDALPAERTAEKDRKSSESEEGSENQTLLEKINQIINDNSSDDSDFNPDDISDSETSDSEEEDKETEIDISMSEIEELKKDQVIINKVPRNDNNSPTQNENKSNVALEKSNARPEEREKYYSPERFQSDREATFYSPISSKSVSPERSVTPTKQKQSNGEHDMRNIENGDVNYVTQFIDLAEQSMGFDDGTSDNVTNGRNEEKRHGKGGKIHHRNKKSNCASRKKK